MAENFRTQILNSKDSSVSTHAPVRTLGSCTFMYLRHSDLYILMVTKNNANVMMAFKYMTSVSSSSSSSSWGRLAHTQCRETAKPCSWREHAARFQAVSAAAVLTHTKVSTAQL